MEQVFSERLARFELQQILEISRREAEPVGTVVHRKAMSVTEQTGLDAVVDEAAEFAEVMYTMKPEEVKDWLVSLQRRDVNLPDQLKDEAIMLAGG